MAAAAAGKALANSGLTAADIDLVIVATCSSVDRCPNVATRVAAKLGIAAPGAYDLNTACSGFCYALASADHAIRAGAARNVIVIGAEKLSDFTDWTDRSTAVIFGDGAGAAIVTACADDEEPGISPVRVGLRSRRRNDAIQIEGWRPYIQQAGQAVFRWATFALPTLALRGLRARRCRPEDLGAFVPHQANLRIIEPLARKLGSASTRWSPRTSSSPATPPPPASRWPCRSCWNGGRCPRAHRSCSSASAAASPTPGRLFAARDSP